MPNDGLNITIIVIFAGQSRKTGTPPDLAGSRTGRSATVAFGGRITQAGCPRLKRG
jgi:hypothetical protein